MKLEYCTICAGPLTEKLACPPCDAAEAIIDAGGALPHYHEVLSEKIAQMMQHDNWLAKPINLRNIYPRFS